MTPSPILIRYAHTLDTETTVNSRLQTPMAAAVLLSNSCPRHQACNKAAQAPPEETLEFSVFKNKGPLPGSPNRKNFSLLEYMRGTPVWKVPQTAFSVTQTCRKYVAGWHLEKKCACFLWYLFIFSGVAFEVPQR